MNRKLSLIAAVVVLGAASSAGAQQADPGPTCTDILDIDTHGQHIVGDYVTGIGHVNLEWPPSGGVIGEAVSENGGVAVRGGPSPEAHAPFAPGASFCTDSQSPGMHL